MHTRLRSYIIKDEKNFFYIIYIEKNIHEFYSNFFTDWKFKTQIESRKIVKKRIK